MDQTYCHSAQVRAPWVLGLLCRKVISGLAKSPQTSDAASTNETNLSMTEDGTFYFKEAAAT